jgi:adenylate/nucleoside-diphosphate kinase
VQSLVIRPEDTLPFVNESIKSFKDALLHILEDQMANMDQSYLLELDANLSPTVLGKQLFLRLQSYLINRAFRPLRMQDPIITESTEEEGQEAAPVHVDSGEVEEAFTALESKRRISVKFKWRRSKFSYYCPVSLKKGKTVTGRPEYAAAFLDKIYLMNSEEALKEFMANPRPYLLPPQPRAPCKLSVIGCRYTGKTTLSSLLAKKYNAKVIEMEVLIKPELEKAKQAMIENAKATAKKNAIELIKVQFRENLEKEQGKFFI